MDNKTKNVVIILLCVVMIGPLALDLRTGLLSRSFVWRVDEKTRVRLRFERFTSMEKEQFCEQKIVAEMLDGEAEVTVRGGLDFSRIHNTIQRPAFREDCKHADGGSCEIQATTT